VQLTNADRRVLLESLCAFGTDCAESSAELIDWATRWTATLAPTFGFELSLARDVFYICELLRTAADGEATRIARGGLAYLYRGNRVDQPTLGPLGLLDDAFVAGYAAHAIREEIGGAASYSPPGLSSEEQARAEAMFLGLLEIPEDQDDDLPDQALGAIQTLGSLLDSGLFRRLRVAVRFLGQVLRERGRSRDHRQIARAALTYVVEEADAIPDSLGPIGFLDDYFVADLAVGLIDPEQTPWVNLIDAVVGAWPFLNMVAFGNGQRGVAASEFLLVNIALTCPKLRGGASESPTHLIVPRTGPLPLLLGFFASLGEVSIARGRQSSAALFTVGQKVLVDGKGVAYVFKGCRNIDGQQMFGVERTRRERGESLSSIQWIPVAQIGRLVPADPNRSALGRLRVGNFGAEPLGALDYLFLSAERVTLPSDLRQIVVVTPAGIAKGLADTVSLYGYRLCDTVPMGSLSGSGDTLHWSARFGSTRPVVLVVPDLDRACEYVELQGDRVALTVIDASGYNAGRLAAMSRLQGLGTRVLVVVAQADADGILEEDTGSMVWEWGRADFEHLHLETGFAPPGAGSIAAYERTVVQAVSSSVEAVHVHAPEADEAFASVTALKRLAEARGDDVPKELENALGCSFAVLTLLLRCPFRLSSHPRLAADLGARLDRLSECGASGHFLTDPELGAIVSAEQRLRALFEVLQVRNPKEDALARLRAAHPDLAVICDDPELLDGVQELRLSPLASVFDLPDANRQFGLVTAGWFGRSTMTRLLLPPFAAHLYLLLYGPEAGWYRSFTRKVRDGVAARRSRTERGRLFPIIGKWPGPAAGDPAPVDEGTQSAADEISDTVETYLLSRRRRLLTSLGSASPSEEAVDARLITFDGGYAFLADNYEAKLANHLLEGTTDGEHAELEVVPARRLRPGDVLLFLRGSSRDVIRQVADQLLNPGERERAGLWRRSLIQYQRQEGCSVELLWKNLSEHGSLLGLAAVANWFADEGLIAPQNVEREVGAILALTKNPDLAAGFGECRAAISRVRGAHLRASNLLARRVITQAIAGLQSAGQGRRAIDLGEGIVLARLREIDETRVRVKLSAANHLIEDSTWLG